YEGEKYQPSSYTGKAGVFSYGADLTASIYFSGGFYLALSAEWIRGSITLDSAVDQENPQTGVLYMDGGTSGKIEFLRIMISSGYAFSN
ncbi:MAG: hypothetical protein ACRCUT_09185, partial [Spirochaetota bacterium]